MRSVIPPTMNMVATPPLVIPHNLAANTGTTVDHDLGYIPAFSWTSNVGNVNFGISAIDTKSISFWNYNVAGNSSSGEVFLWRTFVNGPARSFFHSVLNGNQTFVHDLGYLPILSWTQNAGNVFCKPYYVDEQIVVISEFSTGGNYSDGFVYLW